MDKLIDNDDRSTKNKVTFASGLRPDWNSGGDVVERRKKQTHVQISVGGLGDSDAEAVNPFPSPKSHTLTEDALPDIGEEPKLERNPSRRNDVNTTSTLSIVFSDAFLQLVSIAMSDEEEDYVPHPSKKAKAPRQVVKMEKDNKKPLSTVTTMTVTMKTKIKRLNGNTVRMSDLPKFASEKWRDTFLPTLYDKFFASNQPFEGFYKGSDQFVALLQGIIEEVYPNVNYEVSSSDSIHFLVRDLTCFHIIL
jgi:hypothetical protein